MRTAENRTDVIRNPYAGTDSRLVEPFAWKGLILFVVLINILIILVLFSERSISPFWFSVIGLPCIFFIKYFTEENKNYYTPLLFVIFYVFGFLLPLPHLILERRNLPSKGWAGIGSFSFTDREFLVISCVICAGFIAFVTASLFAEHILKRKKRSGKTLQQVTISARRLALWTVCWFVLSVLLLLLMWFLGIGRTGLIDRVTLPFRIAGILSYSRKIVIPFFGLYFLDLSLRKRRIRLSILILIGLFVIGVIGSIGGISRGIFFFTLFPSLIYLFFTSRKGSVNKKLFVNFIIAGIVSGIIMVYILDTLRTKAYKQRGLNVKQSVTILKNIREVNLIKASSFFFTYATVRIEGMGRLMAVSSAPAKSTSIPFKLFWGDQELRRRVDQNVVGFNPSTGNNLAFGFSYGIFAFLYLSGSLMIVYSGVTLIMIFIMMVEEIFLRHGNRSHALLFSILLCFELWHSPSTYTVVRYLAVLLLCLCLSKTVRKSIKATWVKTT